MSQRRKYDDFLNATFRAKDRISWKLIHRTRRTTYSNVPRYLSFQDETPLSCLFSSIRERVLVNNHTSYHIGIYPQYDKQPTVDIPIVGRKDRYQRVIDLSHFYNPG
jgi:hypothetical protein